MWALPPLDVLARVPLLPVLIWQGLSIRRNALILPEASGPRSGVLGAGPDINVLILGDSSAAGVGVATQAEALSGQFTAGLSANFRVSWELVARTGATTDDAVSMLGEAKGAEFDIALLALGVNDAVRLVSVSKWRAKQRALRQRLRDEFGVQMLLVTAVPPLSKFPALTPILKWILGHQAMRLDCALRDDLNTETDAVHLMLDVELGPDAMAVDGYHPSEETYALWGRGAAEICREQFKKSSG